jgi:hypothetical protein
MKMSPVSSSNLSAVGYDEHEKWLVVEFKDGGMYRYLQVPAPIFQAFMDAPSKGAYFSRSIKDRFRFVKL